MYVILVISIVDSSGVYVRSRWEVSKETVFSCLLNIQMLFVKIHLHTSSQFGYGDCIIDSRHRFVLLGVEVQAVSEIRID